MPLSASSACDRAISVSLSFISNLTRLFGYSVGISILTDLAVGTKYRLQFYFGSKILI